MGIFQSKIAIPARVAPTSSPQLDAMVQEALDILLQLEKYQGCQDAIRAAISKPTPENEEKCLAVLEPHVLQLQRFYEFCIRVSQIQWDSSSQAITMLDFVYTFDSLKMSKPAVQNDFSFYRRSCAKLKLQNKVLCC